MLPSFRRHYLWRLHGLLAHTTDYGSHLLVKSFVARVSMGEETHTPPRRPPIQDAHRIKGVSVSLTPRPREIEHRGAEGSTLRNVLVFLEL